MILYNVRAASIDFVLALIDTYDTAALKSLWSAFETRAASSDAARSRGEEDWCVVNERDPTDDSGGRDTRARFRSLAPWRRMCSSMCRVRVRTASLPHSTLACYSPPSSPHTSLQPVRPFLFGSPC